MFSPWSNLSVTVIIEKFIDVIVYIISVLKEVFEREPTEDKHRQSNVFLG